MGKREKRGGDVAAEGVRLIGPIEAVGASSVAGEGVLGLGVVFEDLREVWIVLVEWGIGRGGREGREGHGHGHGG